MTDDLNLFTGKLTFKDIDFTFVFNGEILRLIPPDNERDTILFKWAMKEIVQGTSSSGDLMYVEEKTISGHCNETNEKIVFIPNCNIPISFYNSDVIIGLFAYVVYKKHRQPIDRISFSSPEINYIHPVNQAFSLYLNTDDYINNGTVSLKTANHDTTSTEKQTFFVDQKEISVYFSITTTISTSIDKPPLSANSCLMFEFEETTDYDFILRLCRIAQNFVRFLCYRKNIFIPNVAISSPYAGGKHEEFATMYILGQDGECEYDVLKKGRYIKQIYFAGFEGRLLSEIAEDNIYLRHLPDTYQSGLHKTAARFVMITAAFEWEFHRLYPNGIKKSEGTINAENQVIEEIEQLIDSNTGKKKAIYKQLKRLVRSDSLESEIVQFGKDFSKTIDIFGKRLYSLNHVELNYSEIGKRVSTQRNHFAHGDLDKEFIGESLCDIVYMELMIYAMQLRHLGIDNVQIQRAINDLFQQRIAI